MSNSQTDPAQLGRIFAFGKSSTTKSAQFSPRFCCSCSSQQACVDLTRRGHSPLAHRGWRLEGFPFLAWARKKVGSTKKFHSLSFSFSLSLSLAISLSLLLLILLSMSLLLSRSLPLSFALTLALTLFHLVTFSLTLGLARVGYKKCCLASRAHLLVQFSPVMGWNSNSSLDNFSPCHPDSKKVGVPKENFGRG